MGHTGQHDLINIIKTTMSIVIPRIPTVVSASIIVGFGTPKKVVRMASLIFSTRDFKGKSSILNHRV